MKFLILAIFLLSFLNEGNAQAKILVQTANTNAVTLYWDLQTAVDSAAPNSIIYLGGGLFTFASGYVINKPVNIVGVGYNNDSTLATGKSEVSHLIFGSGANGSSVTGCYLGTVTFNTSTANIAIYRCNVFSISMLSNVSNILIEENIIRRPAGGNLNALSGTGITTTNITISQNIIIGSIEGLHQCVFKNNIMMANYYLLPSVGVSVKLPFQDVKNCSFTNNYIYSCYDGYGYNLVSNVFTNNVIENNLPGGTNTSINTISQSFTTIFEAVAANNVLYPDINYQIKSTSPAKNYGTDGTDIGIFGTSKPWKIGGLPDYPHVYFINIADENTGPNGTLPVQVKVSAQSSN